MESAPHRGPAGVGSRERKRFDSIARVSAVRILLDYRPALRQRTGVGEYVHELARALTASAPADETLTLFSASWRDRLSADAVPGARRIDRRWPVRVLNAAWHRLGWPPAEQVTGESFDVVHAAHPLLIPSRDAAQSITVHDLDFLDHPERTRAEIRRDYPALARSHARRADRIVVISRATARDVEQRLDVPASKISICYPGGPDWAPRTSEPAAAEACLLFLGTLEPRKNLGVLLDAYERLIARVPAAPPLVLAGRVSDAAGDIVRRTKQGALTGRVVLTGYLPDDQRELWYRRAIAFVMPSHYEGFGMPVLEALTVGVPVVAADRGALPEVVGDAGRLVPPDDPEAIAAALSDLLTDPGQRDRLRAAGWAQARRFRWEDAARSVREAWGLAIEARARRG
jgi:glycosyltransferase involved in cell wall biosynthesis